MTAMGKEASLDGLEFDGETVLCRVCGDKASGFHYGVHACEGCKGFFRRSIQQKIQYRPCLKNQQCNIMRVNRNRCQYCRLKKCISVGMSRDAVRFGRVPKKEKARIMEQMQKVNSQSNSTVLSEILENESELVHTVVTSHKMTNEFTKDRVQRLRQEAFQRNDFMSCPAHMACPLNVNAMTDDNDNKQKWEEFSEYFTPAIKCVVDFAKSIPGFQMLSQDDQVTLLKAGTFEVLLLRFVSLFDPTTNTMLFTNGKLFKRQHASSSGTAGFLLDSMFDFADRFSKLNLTDEEMALFSAIILLAPDRPGLRNTEQVERIQNKLTQALQNMINSIHMDDSTLFAKLLMKTTDLRTLNTLHSEKLIGPQMKESERLTNPMFHVKQEHVPMETEAPANEMLLNFGSPPTGTPLVLGARPGIDIPLGAPAVPVVPQRMPLEGNSHQKMVLQTPYGTFYREEVSGFYGYLPDQPRQRCHTLDRETMSRPSRSLHVIDEGNRRRYTLDKEYISKMVNKLSHKLEKRAAINDDYNPPSVSSSVCSSPVPDDPYNRIAMGSTPDSSSCSSRTSPIPGKERYSPGSPNPRSRSGSMVEKDYEIRRRCYSFHLNSEGRAARNLHTVPHPMDSERLLRDGIQPPYSADARRGSVGASYGLHRHEKALLMERGGAHLLQNPDAFYRGFAKRPAKMSMEDSLKFQRVQTSVGLSAPTLSAQLAASPLDKSHSPPSQTTPPRNEIPKLAWISPEGARRETVSPPSLEAASNDATKIVVSDFSSGVVHKKFDKFRKTSPQPPLLQAQEKERSMNNSTAISSAEKRSGSLSPSNDKSAKPSAAEAHPQLMAHLQAPPPPPTLVSSASQSVMTSQSPSMAHLSTEPQVVMATASSQPASTAVSQASNHGDKLLSETEEKHIRDQVHASTMLSLKDKLLKKIDSMDNLTKIGNGNKMTTPKKEAIRPSVSGATCTTSVFTTQPPHTMYAPSPIYTSQVPLYPPYYGLRYPTVSGLQMVPQANFSQSVPAMPHLAPMYTGPVPHLRPVGQPLNLSKSIDDLPKAMPSLGSVSVDHGVPSLTQEKRSALGRPQRPASEEMFVS